MDAAARPLPSDDTTPPVTKMYLMEESCVFIGCFCPAVVERLGACPLSARSPERRLVPGWRAPVPDRLAYPRLSNRTAFRRSTPDSRARGPAAARAAPGVRAASAAAPRASAESRG